MHLHEKSNLFAGKQLRHCKKISTILYKILTATDLRFTFQGAQWVSGRVLDSRPRGRGFEPHRCHCIAVLEQDTFIIA